VEKLKAEIGKAEITVTRYVEEKLKAES